MTDHLPTFLMLVDGVLQDVTADVRQTSPVKIDWGGSVVSNTPKTGAVDLTFSDREGKYRVHDARSPLYGKVGRNTPLYVVDLLGVEDFEDTTYFVTPGDDTGHPFARSTTSPHSGSWCLKSPSLTNGQAARAIFNVPTGCNMVTFWYRTDCPTDSTMVFATGGYVRARKTGQSGAWTQLTLPVGANDSFARQLYVSYFQGATAGGAVYLDDVTFYSSRAATEIVSWAPDRTVAWDQATGRGDQWCDIHAEGLLGRIGGWTEPLDSAMTRSISRLSGVRGHWPGEDGRGATQLANRVAGGSPAVLSGSYDLGDDNTGPSGSASAVKLDATTVIQGKFQTATTNGWIIGLVVKLAAIPGSTTSQPIISWTTSNGYTWSISINNASRTIDVVDSGGHALYGTAFTWTANEVPTSQVAMIFKATDSGGTVTFEFDRVAEFATTYTPQTATFSGTAGKLSTWTVTGNSYLQDAELSQVFGTSDATQTLIPGTYAGSISGFAGDTAIGRMSRLLTEEGFQFVKYGPESSSVKLGPQRPNTLFKLLQQCADTDGGLLNSAAGGIAVEYRARREIAAQAVALALTYGQNVAPPIKPALDNQSAYNQVVAQQEDGGSYTAEDDSSSMGTNPPPQGIGVVKQTVNVTVQDQDMLQQIAHWWLNVGTDPAPRYPQVTIDLDANPELEASANALRPGDRITVSDLDPDPIDLLVIGKADQQTSQKRRRVVLNCLPFGRWRTLGLGTGRLDAKYTIVFPALDATSTTLNLFTGEDSEQWRPGPSGVHIMLGGEEIILGTIGTRTGSNPWTQQVTGCTRGVNGVQKAHAITEFVKVKDALRLGMGEAS